MKNPYLFRWELNVCESARFRQFIWGDAHRNAHRDVSTTLLNAIDVRLELDIDGSVLLRTVTNGAQTVEHVKYSTGVVQFYLHSANQVTGTTQGLPGGVSVTDANNTTTTSTFKSRRTRRRPHSNVGSRGSHRIR